MDLEILVLINIDGVVVGIVGKHNIRVANLPPTLNHLRPHLTLRFVTGDHALKPGIGDGHRMSNALDRVTLCRNIKEF